MGESDRWQRVVEGKVVDGRLVDGRVVDGRTRESWEILEDGRERELGGSDRSERVRVGREW